MQRLRTRDDSRTVESNVKLEDYSFKSGDKHFTFTSCFSAWCWREATPVPKPILGLQDMEMLLDEEEDGTRH